MLIMALVGAGWLLGSDDQGSTNQAFDLTFFSIGVFGLGGYYTAYHSPTETYMEPALAAVLAIAVIMVLGGSMPNLLTVQGTILLAYEAALPFLAALGGAVLGEASRKEQQT